MCTKCVPNVYQMCTKCVPNVYRVCTKCVPNVYRVCTKSYQIRTRRWFSFGLGRRLWVVQVGGKHFRGAALKGPEPKLACAMNRLTGIPTLGTLLVLLSDQSHAQRSIPGCRLFGLGKCEENTSPQVLFLVDFYVQSGGGELQ